jgi:putative Mg2+ transporter-C (MgtC) family protein
MGEVDFLVRILVAVGLGAAIGLERQWHQRLAGGLRTHALVALGAAAFVALATLLPGSHDATRLAAQVVSGMGFLGAGVILREGLHVRGLNTAATLWCTAAVGVLAGHGFLAPAALTTAGVLGAHVLLRPLGRVIARQPVDPATVERSYRLQAICPAQEEPHIRTLLVHTVMQDALRLKALRSEDLPGVPRVQIQADLVTDGRGDRLIEHLTSRLSIEPAVTAISWEHLDEAIVE